jgi:glycine reductase complex component B subunit gamma
VQICTMTPVAVMVGSPRVVPGMRIVNPLGNADLSPEAEKTLRREIVSNALQALLTQIQKPTLFERN